MPILYVVGRGQCEGCGKQFNIELESGIDAKKFTDLESLVRDSIRISMQGGRILCDECIKKCDIYPEEDNLTQ